MATLEDGIKKLRAAMDKLTHETDYGNIFFGRRERQLRGSFWASPLTFTGSLLYDSLRRDPSRVMSSIKIIGKSACQGYEEYNRVMSIMYVVEQIDKAYKIPPAWAGQDIAAIIDNNLHIISSEANNLPVVKQFQSTFLPILNEIRQADHMPLALSRSAQQEHKQTAAYRR